MSSNFTYASEADLNKYFNKSSDYDNKSLITTGWTSLGNNVYIAHDTGLISQLFQDGKELNPHNKIGIEGYFYKTALTADLEANDDTDGLEYNVVNYNASFTTGSESDLQVGDYVNFNSGGSSNEKGFIEAVNTGANQITVRRAALDSTSFTWTTSSSSTVESWVRVTQINSWFYDAYYDQVILYSTTDPNDLMMEKGTDSKTFTDQTLVDASLELHNYLDQRYSTPIEKSKQIDIDTAVSSVAEEYDPIIIKSVCYIAASNMIRAKEGASKEADYYHALVTNVDRTGIIDKLNDGIFKLSFEVDANDKKGKIKYRSVAGTMDIVEIGGTYTGELYDLLKVEIESTGAYGVSSYKTHYYGNDKLYGSTSGTDTITGGLQSLEGGSGLYVRFQGASATDGDIWEIEVFSSGRKQTNKSNATIEMVR